MAWGFQVLSPARQSIQGSTSSSAKVLQKQRNMPWKRFEIDAVGKDWYCPYPQRWKEISELNRKRKAAHHKERDARRKREHQIAYALREQEALKAAEPQTPPRPKGVMQRLQGRSSKRTRAVCLQTRQA